MRTSVLAGYAIQFTPQGKQEAVVSAIYAENPKYDTGIVADSFSEFVERYLADDISLMDLSVEFPSRGELAIPKASILPVANRAHPLWGRVMDQ
jgi:hypothetical protein